MKTATITLYGESKTERVEITHFSMLEPSTSHVRFVDTKGIIREAHGLMISASGDLDSLPSAINYPA